MLVMKLTDMMIYADISQLHQLANTYQCRCNVNSKHELIQSILSEIMRKEVIRMKIAELTKDEYRFLHNLMFDVKEVFSVEELLVLGQSSKCANEIAESSHPRTMIKKFKGWGWLFHGHTSQTKALYFIAKDLRKKIQDELRNQMQHQIVSLSYSPQDVQLVKSLSLDIEQFLTYIDCQSSLLLKANYCLSKRDLDRILNGFHMKEIGVSQQGCRFGFGRMFHAYPNRFSFIYDYCMFREYIEVKHPHLLLTERGKQRLQKNIEDDSIDLYSYWLKLYRTPIPNLSLIVQWIDQFTQSWVTFNSLQQAICPLINPYYYDCPETIFEVRIVQMLYYLNFLSYAHDAEHGRLLRFTPDGHACLNELRIAK